VIAHIAGVPVEETLLPVLSGLGAVMLLVRSRIASHARRTRRP
jgi:hypothetical protein